MSQKETKFQNKTQKSGKNFSRDDRKSSSSHNKSEFGRNSKSKQGHTRDSEGKSASFDGEKRSYSRKPSSDRDDKPRKSYGEKRSYGRDSSSEGGEKRSYNKKPSFDRDDKPRKSYGEKRSYGRDSSSEGGEKRSYNKKPSFDRDDKPRKSYGEKRSYGRDSSSDGGEKRSYNRKPSFDRDDKPRKSYGEKRSYGRDSSSEGGEKRSYNRKPSFDRDDKPRKSYEGKLSLGKETSSNIDAPQTPSTEKREYKKTTEKKFSHKDTYIRDGKEYPKRDKKLYNQKSEYGNTSPTYLYGVHAVVNALQNPERKHNRLFYTDISFEHVKDILEKVEVPELIKVDKDEISKMLPKDAVHQGIMLDTSPLPEVFLSDILIKIKGKSRILILDKVTDPHNVGAIMRSGAALGADAIILQKLYSPDITGLLAKTACGAVEHIPLIKEVNLNKTIEKLQLEGFYCIGLDERGEKTIAEYEKKDKIALILGAEGDGIRPSIAESCDGMVKLPTHAPIYSLNVSNAAAIGLYELIR